MADYFSNALHGRTAVSRSYRYIRLTRRNRQAFLDNLAAAYSVMARQGESKGGGLTGAEYMQLIKMLCQDFPNDVIVSLTPRWLAMGFSRAELVNPTSVISYCLLAYRTRRTGCAWVL